LPVLLAVIGFASACQAIDWGGRLRNDL